MTPKAPNLQQEEENLIQKIFAKYMPYWPLFVIAFILAVLSAWLYIKSSTPIYQATATLIIKDEKKGNEESKITESLDQISSKKIVENEIEVLQSRKLMQDVASKLNLFTPISEKKSFKYTSAYYSSPIIAKALEPELLQSKANIPLSYDEAKKTVTIENKYTYPLDSSVNTPYGKMVFAHNDNYQSGNNSNHPYFLSIYSPREIVPGLLSKLKAEPSGKLSSIVNLSYLDEVPARAEKILNQLINSYRQSEIDDKNSLARNTLEFVNKRIALVTGSLDTIQQKVQAYKSGKDAVDISTQGQLYLQNVSQNDQKLGDVNSQISVLNQVESFVKNSNNSEGIVPSTLGVSDPMLSELLTKLNGLELEYEKGKATIGENNPRLLEIKDQITKIKPNILKNINSQQKSLYAMRNNISSTNSSYNSMLRQVPQKERQLIDISREEQNKRDIYQFLLQKKEESEIAYASSVANNKVVDYAEAGANPVSPKKMIIYVGALALFMGLLLFYIAIKESMNGKVLYRQEIESRTEIPIIGEVAFDKSKKPLVIEAGKRSFIAEEFRKLRLSLTYLGIDATHKKILVTSSISGEGKSFIASNLAISMTLTGKKVALIDMDLNNPTHAKIFNLESGVGVSDFLQGRAKISEIIKELPTFKDLSLVTAGNLPENPTELLSNGKVEGLIEYFDKNYDVVIIDTSPMVLVTDGYLLTHLCDATLYVIRHGYTPKILVKRIDENNQINPIHNPAIIFNGVKQKGYLATNYGYGYGYDYVYGQQKPKKGLFKKS
ncbi:MAG: polysaccharide biosynthesis tyrosine autokinase [Bacteroidetes bacterium]|nr:polysaccharide biosynthesis tyrosine autokinase [Bacteroidota bacterium]